jgi:hypothetical protein
MSVRPGNYAASAHTVMYALEIDKLRQHAAEILLLGRHADVAASSVECQSVTGAEILLGDF